MQEKEIKKEVKLLAEQKQFEQIYHEYGPKYFRKYVSRKYKRKDLNKLRREGKYFDIYEKYGEKELDYLSIYAEDVKNEAGRKKSLPMEIVEFGRVYIRGCGIVLAGIAGAFLGLLGAIGIREDITKIQNSQKYAKEIDAYKEKIKEYSKKFNIHKQSDMEIIMRVMKDMHKTIRGYGKPKIDATGYEGMDVMDEDGIGVCRNMAENVADKLNAINPEYNARTICLYAKGEDYEGANISHNTIEGNTRTNRIGNVTQTYVDEKLSTRTIDYGDTIITREYKENLVLSKETIQSKVPNETEEIFYDENRNIIERRKSIKENNENSEKEKQFVNGKLSSEIEKTKNYYMRIDYDDRGKIKRKTIADKDSERTTWYGENKKIQCVTIIKDNYQTTIYYNELGIEVDRKKEKTDKTNQFLDLIEQKQKEKDQKEQENEEMKLQISNHRIVAVDLKDEGITLLIDPTWLGLGIYKDGVIHMFNEKQDSEAIYNNEFLGYLGNKGIEAFWEYPIDYIKSFKEPTLSMEELEKKYGLEAQNEMLKKIEEEDKRKTDANNIFKENLKIDKGVTYNFDTNTVTFTPDDLEAKEEENQKSH